MNHRRMQCKIPAPVIEALESRWFLSADLRVEVNGSPLDSGLSLSTKDFGRHFGFVRYGDSGNSAFRHYGLFNNGDTDAIYDHMTVPTGFKIIHQPAKGTHIPPGVSFFDTSSGSGDPLVIALDENALGPQRGYLKVSSNGPDFTMEIEGTVGKLASSTSDNLGVISSVQRNDSFEYTDLTDSNSSGFLADNASRIYRFHLNAKSAVTLQLDHANVSNESLSASIFRDSNTTGKLGVLDVAEDVPGMFPKLALSFDKSTDKQSKVLDVGDYLVKVYTAGHPSGNFSVNYQMSLSAASAPTADAKPPVPMLLTALRVRTSGGTFYKFMVEYDDDKAMDAASVESSDITVTGPGGFSSGVRLLSKSVSSDGKKVAAFYRLAARGGTWDRGDNGVYTINVNASQVKDAAGNFILPGPTRLTPTKNGVPIAGADLVDGQFSVKIPITPAFIAAPVFSALPITRRVDDPVWDH